MRRPTGSKTLLKAQLKKVIQSAIPRISTPAEADALENEVLRCRAAGIFDDAISQEMLSAISVVRNDLYTSAEAE